MENLLIPFVFASPFLLLWGLYRLWQFYTRRIRFKHKIATTVYGVVLTLVMCAYGFVVWLVFRCVWPFQCTEGFASGYAVAAILFYTALISTAYVGSEVMLAFLRKQEK